MESYYAPALFCVEIYMMKKIIDIGSFSLQLLSPLALCIGIAFLMQKKWCDSPWIMLLAILVGIATMMLNVYKLIQRKLKSTKSKDIVSFNNHE